MSEGETPSGRVILSNQGEMVNEVNPALPPRDFKLNYKREKRDPLPGESEKDFLSR